MKRIVLLAGMALMALAAHSQSRVALQSNGVTTIFHGANPFIDAWNASVAGDTIYLPGGHFNGPGSINRTITIIGAGHFIDSTLATGPTVIPGFTLHTGAHNSHFEGLRFTSSIEFAHNVRVDSVTFIRCYMRGHIRFQGTVNHSIGVTVRESIIEHGIDASNARQLRIVNSILPQIHHLTDAYVANNIIFGHAGTWHILHGCNNNLFENNIFVHGGGSAAPEIMIHHSNTNTFVRNAFSINPTGLTLNTWTDNYVNVAAAAIFVNPVNFYSSAGNYALLDPAAFPGTTGNQIGIFGGHRPAKAGFVPSNPRIVTQSIAPQTNAAGELNVSITVSAQGN